jgi:glucose/arabinose dehydrogenase
LSTYVRSVTRRRVALVLSAAALALPLTPAPAQAKAVALATRMQIPWAMAMLPDGSGLVTERESGKVFRIVPGRPRALVATVTETRPSGEGGLLGIVAAPDFATTRQYFVYYTTATDNRVARMTYGSSARPVPIVTGIPKGEIHNGGGLVFNRRNELLIGTGDSGDKALPQDRASLGGKVLWVTRSGAAVPGNPWGRIASIGHRNVQGLTLARDERLYASELGQDTFDEVNQIRSGRNYGWPLVEGLGSDPRYTNPIQVWAPSEASPSGITHINSTLYVGGLRGQRLWKLDTLNGVVTKATPLYVGTFGRIRGVANRGNGVLWLTTSNGNDRDLVIATNGVYP